MANSRFWRVIAAGLVAALFYIGYGLNDSGESLTHLPSLTTELQAGDVATANSGGSIKIVTTSDDGRTIRIWKTTHTSNGVHFVGAFAATK